MAPDAARAAIDVINQPWMDEITLAFALEGLQALQLGTGSHTDVVSISLSSTDAVGHRYGPASRELHDQVLRVDRFLGVFLDSFFKLRDSTRVVIALTSDHGVTPFPETQPASAEPRGVRTSLSALNNSTRQALQQKGLAAGAFAVDAGVAYVDPAAFAAARIDMDSLATAYAAAARAIPGILRVDTYKSLLAADTVADHVARRWLHMFPPDVPVLFIATLQPNSMWRSTDAMHGTPHDADANVPIILFGRPFAPGRYADTVRVVDIAPTLARVANLTPAERLDGRVIQRALR
jgi:arylsulfatase A-like enzyme